MILPFTSSQLQPQSPQPLRLHQPRHRRPPNPRPRKLLLPRQRQQPKPTPVIHTTMRHPIDRVINTNPVNHRYTIRMRTQLRRPPKHRPLHSITKLNRTVRPGNSNIHVRHGTSTILRRNPTRLLAAHARGRHNQAQLLPRLRRRHRVRCRRHMRASSMRRRRRRVNAQWQIRLRQRRRAGNHISLPRVGRGRDLLEWAGRVLSRRPCHHI